MLVRGVEDIQAVSEQAALLRVAMLVARDEPLESLFESVSRRSARLLGVEAGAVMRFVGAERAVIVGVYRMKGVRGLPVNAELDFHRSGSALGQAQTTLAPARVANYEGTRGELPVLLKSVGLKATVAAPVLRDGEAWGALVASAAEEESLPPGCEQRLVGARRAARPGARQRGRAGGAGRVADAAGRGRRRDPPAAGARAARGRAPARRRARAEAARRLRSRRARLARRRRCCRRARRRDGGQRRDGRAGARAASRGALRARARGGAAGARGARAGARAPARAAGPALSAR